MGFFTSFGVNNFIIIKDKQVYTRELEYIYIVS